MKSKLRICVIVPVLGAQNSILYVFSELKKIGCNIIVITSTSGGYKSKSKNSPFEIIDGLEIHRIADQISSKSFLKEIESVKLILDKTKPNVVLFGTWGLFKIGYKISRLYDAKLIWLTEFYFNERRFIGGRKYYLGLKFLIKPVAFVLRNYFSKNVDRIILSDISEKKYISETSKKLVSVGWCNNLPSNYNADRIPLNLKLNQAIFAGSLITITINDNFVKAVSYLLNNSVVEKVIVIGDGPQRPVIDELIYQYGSDKIVYLGQMDRIDVLDLIKKSKLALNTTYEGGWGFIGECFALGTLLLYTRNHYLFNHKKDSYLLKFDQNNLQELISLIENESCYATLQEYMIQRFHHEHSAKAIAGKYYNLMYTTVDRNE